MQNGFHQSPLGADFLAQSQVRQPTNCHLRSIPDLYQDNVLVGIIHRKLNLTPRVSLRRGPVETAEIRTAEPDLKDLRTNRLFRKVRVVKATSIQLRPRLAARRPRR
jgi:hypothetical protein